MQLENVLKWGYRVTVGGVIVTCMTYAGFATFAPQNVENARKNQSFLSFWKEPTPTVKPKVAAKAQTSPKVAQKKPKQANNGNQKVGGKPQQQQSNTPKIKSKPATAQAQPVQSVQKECETRGYWFFRQGNECK